MSEHRNLRDAVWALAHDGGLGPNELLVALRLVEHWPRIFPGVESLVSWTRLSERTVRRSLRALERAGVIRTLHTPGRGNQYQFLDASGAPIRVLDLGGGVAKPRPQGPPTPRSQWPDPPVTVTAPPVTVAGPTPVTVAAEADPDPKQEIQAGNPKRESARARGAHTLPETWEPTAEHATMARSLGLDLSDQYERMRDWAASSGARKASWDATFRNWLRRSADAGGRGAVARGPQRSRNSDALDYAFAIAAGKA